MRYPDPSAQRRAEARANAVDAPKTPTRKDTVPLECAEQKLFFRLVKEYTRDYPFLRHVAAVPNGGTRNRREAKMLVAEGVKRGVPDTFCPVPVGRYHGWFGELKRLNGVPSDLSDEQRDWLESLRSMGYRAEWHKGGRAMFDDLLAYLRGEIE